MTALVVGIILVFALIFFAYISFQAGIVKTVFAVLAGFVSIILAENYPYQYGINYYLIFSFSALVIFFIGLFVVKVLKFLCLSLFDKLAGAVFGIFLWLVISTNFLVPYLTQGAQNIKTEFIDSVSGTVQKNLPVFGEYIPDFLVNKK